MMSKSRGFDYKPHINYILRFVVILNLAESSGFKPIDRFLCDKEVDSSVFPPYYFQDCVNHLGISPLSIVLWGTFLQKRCASDNDFLILLFIRPCRRIGKSAQSPTTRPLRTATIGTFFCTGETNIVLAIHTLWSTCAHFTIKPSKFWRHQEKLLGYFVLVEYCTDSQKNHCTYIRGKAWKLCYVVHLLYSRLNEVHWIQKDFTLNI